MSLHYYTKDQTDQIKTHKFAFIELEISDKVLTITLNRPAKRNALHPQMVNEIAFALNHASYDKDVWMVVLRANGKVFCAGADLKAMAGIIEENDSTVPMPNGEVLMGQMFNKLYKPTIAVVSGDVYAGGFFFLAGCRIVLSANDIVLGLPEVKRGLYPFQVMAALLRVMPERKVIDWCIRGYSLNVLDAEKFGLITQVVDRENLEDTLDEIVKEIKENSPSAIRLGLSAYDHIRPSHDEQDYLNQMLQSTIMTKDGQEGLTAFREKRRPVWLGE